MSLSQRWRRLHFRYASRWRNLRHHWRTAEWEAIAVYQQGLTGSARLPLRTLLTLLWVSWRHGASLSEYYRFRFFEKDTATRRTYLTASLRYEITRQLNDPEQSEILRDKLLFARHFADVLGRPIWTWEQLQAQPAAETPPRLVLKDRRGQQGAGMLFSPLFDTWQQARQWVQQQAPVPDDYIYEAWIDQHPALAAFNPNAVNTLRVVTCLQGDTVQIWGVAQRFGIGTTLSTDNGSQGNIGAWVSDNGRIERAAVKKDPAFAPCSHHPLSGVAIVGFEIPYFEAVLALARQSARRLPKVRSVGWDIAVTPTGPCLIEGNDNWNCQILQITGGHGQRHLATGVCAMDLVYD